MTTATTARIRRCIRDSEYAVAQDPLMRADRPDAGVAEFADLDAVGDVDDRHGAARLATSAMKGSYCSRSPTPAQAM